MYKYGSFENNTIYHIPINYESIHIKDPDL